MLDTKWPKLEKLPQYCLGGLLAKDEKVCEYVAHFTVLLCIIFGLPANNRVLSAPTMDPPCFLQTLLW